MRRRIRDQPRSTTIGDLQLQRGRKPLVTSINDLNCKALSERLIRHRLAKNHLQPPENGLLVQSLIPIVHQVFDARSRLFRCVSVVFEIVLIYRCGSCGGEVHVGRAPHRIPTWGGGEGRVWVDRNAVEVV
ncbi:hypothetical protein QJS04_geneDACA017271 [Acorus gramineus]|uniref:APO domain-containing protein n=1 Tax=Acorus gramineus TaxID=55184 RepID=A0AAV9A2T0_ACOGR|nr:hypothetical protein QJS04_geneDACA017271 [Acorus gramineus]